MSVVVLVSGLKKSLNLYRASGPIQGKGARPKDSYWWQGCKPSYSILLPMHSIPAPLHLHRWLQTGGSRFAIHPSTW